MQSKYVAGLRSGTPCAVVFGDTVGHNEVASAMFDEVSSAGFVSIQPDQVQDGVGSYCEVKVALYGRSTSLDVNADDKDLWLVQRALGLPTAFDY